MRYRGVNAEAQEDIRYRREHSFGVHLRRRSKRELSLGPLERRVESPPRPHKRPRRMNDTAHKPSLGVKVEAASETGPPHGHRAIKQESVSRYQLLEPGRLSRSPPSLSIADREQSQQELRRSPSVWHPRSISRSPSLYVPKSEPSSPLRSPPPTKVKKQRRKSLRRSSRLAGR